jgi:hypothetical protein
VVAEDQRSGGALTFKTEFNKVMLAEIKAGYRFHPLAWTKIPANFVIGASNKIVTFANEADNKSTNGTMESWASATDLNNWTEVIAGGSTINRDSADKHRGTYSCRFDVVSGGQCYIYQTVTLVAGAEYIFTVWTKVTAGERLDVILYDSGLNVSLKSDGTWQAGVTAFGITGTGSWMETQIKFAANASYTSYLFRFQRYGGNTYTARIDDSFICPKRTATLTEATYAADATALCAEIKSKMDAAGAGVHTISYDAGTDKFTFASGTLLYLYLTTTTNALWTTIGFPVTPDVDFVMSYTGNAAPISYSYYIAVPVGVPEIVGLKEDGIALTKRTSSALVQANTSSWYLDFFNGVLYVHLSGGDDPGGFTSPSYHHSVIATVVFCFSSRQFADENLLDFIPYGCTYNHFYEPAIRSGGASSISQGLADHYTGAMQTTFGELLLADAGWWYENR